MWTSVVVDLVIVEPESRRGRHRVRLPLLVGRGPEAKFRIQQDQVSRRHCELTALEGVVHLRDLGSRNGTRLEGRPLEHDVPVAVPPGGVVHVGSLAFRVEYDVMAETPTVELAAPSPTVSRTPGTGRDRPFDVEFNIEEDQPPGPADPPPAVATDDGDDDLLRFLEGLG